MLSKIKKILNTGLIKTQTGDIAKWFTQPYSINLVAVRNMDNPNSDNYNDKLFAVYYTKTGQEVIFTCPWTTDAGLFYRTEPMTYKGTAIMQHNIQHKGIYEHRDDPHKNKFGFRQVYPTWYWRDNNNDTVFDFGSLITEYSNSSTNMHPMGNDDNTVGNWSAGCQGAPEIYFKQLYDFCEIQIDMLGTNIMSYTLLSNKLLNELDLNY